jgi:hypothetical protein
LKEFIEEYLSMEWNPAWSIDHDNAEKAALKELDLAYLLCDFHFTRCYKERIRHLTAEQQGQIIALIKLMARARTEEEFDERAEEFKRTVGEFAPEFVTYFVDTFLCADWKLTWSDVLRLQFNIPREGLGNTTNYVEALFKKLLNVFLGEKVRLTVSTNYLL